MIIILHANDTVKPKISKISYTPNTWFTFTSYILKIKSFFKQFTKRGNFNLQYFIVPQLHLSRQKCATGLPAVDLIMYDQTFLFKIYV